MIKELLFYFRRTFEAREFILGCSVFKFKFATVVFVLEKLAQGFYVEDVFLKQ